MSEVTDAMLETLESGISSHGNNVEELASIGCGCTDACQVSCAFSCEGSCQGDCCTTAR